MFFAVSAKTKDQGILEVEIKDFYQGILVMEFKEIKESDLSEDPFVWLYCVRY